MCLRLWIFLGNPSHRVVYLQDMTTDGGGWTLVFHENQPRSCQLANDNANGQRRCGMANSPILASGTSGSAKYADAVINALKTDISARQRSACALVCAHPHLRPFGSAHTGTAAHSCARARVTRAHCVCGDHLLVRVRAFTYVSRRLLCVAA